jgi:hypothetical protein
MKAFTLDQLKAQTEDAQETLIARGIIIDALTELLNKAIQEKIEARNAYLAVSAQYVAAMDAHISQMKEQANA